MAGPAEQYTHVAVVTSITFTHQTDIVTGIDVRAVEQGDDAWHKLRLGVITASEVHNVIAKPRSGKKWPDMKMSYFHTLLAEV
ncbi:exonuclease, partial [Escherichia coli]